MESAPKRDNNHEVPAAEFRVLFEFSPTASLIVLPDAPVFTMVAANDALLRLVGFRREDLLGHGVFEVFPDNQGDSTSSGSRNLRASLQRVVATRLSDRLPLQRYDVEQGAADGGGFDERYWTVVNTPMFAADGSLQYIFHATEEVTEKIRSEQREALAASKRKLSETRFRQLAESNTFGLLIGNLAGTVSYLNPTMRALLGYTEEDVASGFVRWDRITPPEFADLAKDAVQQLAETGKCVPYEKAYLTKDGRRVPILVAPSLLDGAPEESEVACFIVDLTERKKSERDAFLVRLDDATRLLDDAADIMQAAVRLLANHLHVDRCAYCALQADQKTLDIICDFTRPGIPSLVGHYDLTQFGAETARLLRANLPCVQEDVDQDSNSADSLDSFHQGLIAAHISVPLQKAGRLVAALAIHQSTPRRWMPEEIELVQLVANRCWESIERARVTRALQESESWLRLAQKAGRIGSFEWLFKKNRIAWTPELEALYGMPEGTFSGTRQDWGSRVFPEDGIRVGAALQASLARNDAEYANEFRAVLPDGTLRWLRGQGQIFYDDTGAPERIIGVGIDIDARKRAEALLRESEQRLRAIFDGTYEHIGLLAPDGTILEANRASLEFAGNEREDVIGRPFWDTSWFTQTPGAPETIRQYLARAATGEFVRFEAAIRRPSGECQTFDISFHPIFNEQSQVALIVPEARNITERILAEERLRHQWHTFDTVLSNIADFTYTFDLEGRLTYVNRALLSLWQKPFEETLGKDFFELGYPPELASRLQRQIRQVIDTNEPIRDQTDFTGPTGETRQYEYILVPVLADDGSVEAVAGSTRDVTERKMAEERERQREEQFRERARLESLGVMAGGIAHDFNNLLTGILGNASLLREIGPEEIGSVAGQIMLAAQRAAELTNQMLAFSGKASFAVEGVDLDSLVEENLTLLRASLSRNVTITWALECKSCLIEADRAQMQQVVMNLLINASEAIGERPGEVSIRTFLSSRAATEYSPQLQANVASGDYVNLEVRDNGSGMTPDTLRRIFDPFFTTKFTGRGLGLSAVLGIVKGHGGDIKIESQPGAGTVFRILLPLSKNLQSPQPKPASAAAVNASGQTVLVVDDEAIVRQTASLALERRGFRVLEAGNGLEALEVLRAHSEVELVILDLTMPVMTGEQAIPLIHEMRPTIPILLSSGFSEAEISKRFATAGIAGCLQKPYHISAISSRVTELLRNARLS